MVEFTINVTPVSDDTAPAVTQDTAAILEQKSTTALGKVFETLEAGWTVISDGMHDVQAMTETISDKVSALENAVSGMGIVQDISAFTATFHGAERECHGITDSTFPHGLIFCGAFQCPDHPAIAAVTVFRRPEYPARWQYRPDDIRLLSGNAATVQDIIFPALRAG